MNPSSPDFERLVAGALAAPTTGWDFAWARGRWREEKPTWDYRGLVEARLPGLDALLDMGTGGGEFLASLPSRPPRTVATESYPPNVEIARDRLEPLGVRVVAFSDDRQLPLPGAAFSLIINRHESYWLPEVRRLLPPGGVFLTQQVGPLECAALNAFLDAPPDPDAAGWSLAAEVANARQAGLEVERAEEELLDSTFYDIGAVVRFLRIITWQIPDFSLERYRPRLLALHEHIAEHGAFAAHAHRFLLVARRPAA